MTKQINIESIRIDGGTQSRVSINESVVTEYAEVLTEGGELPPVVLFFDGADNWLADGFHRFHAHNKIGAKTIDADVRSGTLTDAKLFSYGANSSHGLRRTNGDKRKAVAGMLAEFADWSDRMIAKHVGVSVSFVSAIRSPAVAAKQQENKAVSLAKKSEGCSPTTPMTQKGSLSTAEAKRELTAPAVDLGMSQELAEAHHTITEMAKDIETLSDKLAIEAMDASEEEKTAAADTIKELRERVKTLERDLDAVKLSRDSFQRENVEMRKQITSLTRKLQKVEA